MGSPADSKLPTHALIARAARQHGDLPTPAEASEGYVVLHAGPFLPDLLAHPQHPLDRRARARVARAELAEQLLLLGRVGREPLGLDVDALEQVRHEHQAVPDVLREAVRALDGLAGRPEDVVDVDHGAGRVGRASHVCPGTVRNSADFRVEVFCFSGLFHLHVFNPAIVSYFPFSVYSAETGGISSHALQDISGFRVVLCGFDKIESKIESNQTSVTQHSSPSMDASLGGNTRAIYMRHMKHRLAVITAEEGTDASEAPEFMTRLFAKSDDPIPVFPESVGK